ncbi:hypothetical protein Hanom_Chr11g00994431 [Helianthus anomalus]
MLYLLLNLELYLIKLINVFQATAEHKLSHKKRIPRLCVRCYPPSTDLMFNTCEGYFCRC